MVSIENETIIYVAGNPNAYPLEYYNVQSQSFEGVIPNLFRDFSQNSIYKIEYYPSGVLDLRKHFAKNLQVDIVSGYQSGNTLPNSVCVIDVADFVQNDIQTTFQIGFTEIAPEAFIQEFTAYTQTVSSQELCGMVVDAAKYSSSSLYTPFITGGLLLALIILIAVLLSKLRKHKKQIEALNLRRETDPDTEIGNCKYLERMFFDTIRSADRPLYSLVYFQVGTSPSLCPEEITDVQKIFLKSAEILQECIASSDVLARVSMDGFVVIHCDNSRTILQNWLKDTLCRLRHISAAYDAILSITAHAGVYPLEIGSSDLDKILLYAHRNAQQACKQGVDYIFCTKEYLTRFADEQQLKVDSLLAIKRQEFQLYLHFWVDAHSRKIIGAEALSRWNHPQNGLLSPGLYIPMMENSGNIDRLDYYNLEKVCDILQRFKQRGITNFFLSCNFSRNTFERTDFVSRCINIIEKYDLPKNMLIFELTESISEKARSQVKKNITALRDYGLGVALDDLGNGFSSFYDLQDYPVTSIKLPMELIHGIQTENGRHIIDAVIRLGHDLGIFVLAEGVETDAHLELLQTLDCDVIQGFRFYVPLPEKEAEKIILKEFCSPDI